MTEKSIFTLEEFKHLEELFRARQALFRRYWRLFKAEQSTPGGAEWKTAAGMAAGLILKNAVKPIFTPLARAVHLDVALIPGKWLLAEASQQHGGTIQQLFRDSRWKVEGDLFVRFGAAMGEAGLRVVDDRQAEKVRLVPVRPETYLTQSISLYDPTPQLALFVTTTKEDGEDVEYAEVFTANEVMTFRNGELHGIGGREARYANALGVVPLVACVHDQGDGRPEPTFDDTIGALEQVNAQAHQLALIIQRHAEPQWAVFGAEAGDLEKDGTAVWFFPEGSDLKAVLAQVDFDGLLAFVKEVKGEMKDSLPELAIRELVGVNRVAAATIELQMAEAVFKIRRLRKPVDMALESALRLAGRAAAQMGLTELRGLDEALIEFDEDRPVLTLDALTRIQIEQAGQSLEISKMAAEREATLLAAGNGDESNE